MIELCLNGDGNLIKLQLHCSSLHPSKIKGWQVAGCNWSWWSTTTRSRLNQEWTSVVEKLDASGRLWGFLFSENHKVLSLIKVWGMKTGLLRQHFLPWRASKPPISPVWLSPQPAPFLSHQQNPLRREKQHQLAPLKMISFVYLLTPVSRLRWNRLAKA